MTLETDPRVCAAPDCGRKLMSEHTWRNLTPQQRDEHRANGWGFHRTRGRCAACYSRARREAAGARPGCSGVPAEVVLEEWEHADLSPHLPLRERCRRFAPRLGMTAGALEKALHRAGVRA